MEDRNKWLRACALLAVMLLSATVRPVLADTPAGAEPPSPTDETFSLHGQLTIVDQYHPAFSSAFRGMNSLDPGSRGNETVSAGILAGVRLWHGGAAYAEAEVDQGFGLSDTFGVAAFPSGEAYKVGDADPYVRLQELFLRQAFDLDREAQAVSSGPDQVEEPGDNVVVTIGKFPVTAMFDTNAFAHDPTSDFLNWAIIDSGAFDYAADAWGFTYGSSVELTQDWWTLRSGVFAMSRVPNGKQLQTDFRQFELLGEAEARANLFGSGDKIKLLGFLNRARTGSYNDAVALGAATNSIPSTALVRKYRSRPGAALNIEQPITEDLGAFVRASFNNGEQEAYEFTEINESYAAGLALKGARWGRPDDTVGAAGVVDGISNAARRYFAAGGLGTLIGDGALPHYATEDVLELYYSAQAASWLATTFDYQFVANPAYNSDRGPVSIFSLRVHAAF